MKLKNIRIQGFKSFDDLVQLDFDDSITCIVGPNGCGKSNVVDAIRWVMGEQSAKHLRGKCMEDIIFVGSETRQASSLSSVEITFVKSSTGFPPQYEKYNEVSIGRHLYRTGESEYFINRQHVRLKDVTDFFLGTGIGTKAYAIIEQGRVEQLITAKPEERRYIIEEAAGISKFKSRKEAALRRIESTNVNLSRLTDIIVELERQVNSLDRQAKKAKRFTVIRDELRDLDLKLASLAYLKLDEKQEAYLNQIKEADGESTTLENEISEDEVWVEEKRIQLAEVEATLTDLQQKVYEWDNNLRLSESRLQNKKDEDSRFEQEIEQIEQQLVELNFNLTGDQNGISQINEKLSMADLECAELDESVIQKEKEASALEIVSQELFNTLEKAREDFNVASNQLTHIAARRDAIAHRLEELTKTKEHDQLELDELTTKYKKLDDILKDTHEDLSDIKQLKLSLGEQAESLSKTLATEEDRISFEGNELQTLKEELLAKKSRFDSLKELEKNFEGYHEGPRNILKQHQQGERQKVLGSVADFIEVDTQYENAISAVLGEGMQSVVVPTQNDGIACAEYLKTSSAGRSSFIALSLGEANTNSTASQARVVGGQNINLHNANYLSDKECGTVIADDQMCVDVEPDYSAYPGVQGSLKRFVNMKQGYEHLASFLFADVLLVDSLKNAFEAWLKLRKPVVTLEGEFISDRGILTGGTLENTSKALLEKKREIKVLDDVVDKLITKVKDKEFVCLELKNKISCITSELEHIRSSGHEEDLKLANQEKDVLHFTREMESLNARRGKLTQEIVTATQSLEAEEEQLEELKEEEETLTILHDEASLLLTERKSEEENYRKELTLTQEELTKEKISLARAKEQRAYFLQEIERLISDVVKTNQEIIRLTHRESFMRNRSDFTQKRIDFYEKYVQKILGQKDTVDTAYLEAKNNFEELNAHVREKEHELKDKHRKYNHIKDALNEAAIHLTEVRGELSRNNEQVLERYQKVLSEIYTENLPDENEFNEVEAAERAGELRRKMGNIGSVNLEAVDELNELSERFIFLSEQKKDLEDSLQALERAIQKINRTTRKRFQETFDLVNGKFTKIFPRLFKGGHAYMQLTDPENILETGVDIIAQPPGKKLQSVSLLSGGEKALTAISLLFAVFLIKPSPFCLLDEVDAPLDDVNVDRYNEIVKELSQNTQFIVITHNKRTMQSSSCLFGVTMQDDGVSRIVSVLLDD